MKIGMTRRLEPLDRIRELGDASVPFPFDIHRLYFSDDAVTLENELHNSFAASPAQPGQSPTGVLLRHARGGPGRARRESRQSPGVPPLTVFASPLRGLLVTWSGMTDFSCR
ncbi:GIY-YIG nuclease family protein [Modestobacter sp. VKM Ac-2980]|uniref:GIY-YIG nuclease family protein n=1 Tax=unclassified Modestobacter TaxID=2643866 RepID=UPI003FA55A8A